MTTPRLVVGLMGESGTPNGVRLLELLRPTEVETHLVMCSCARRGIAVETGRTPEDVRALADRTYGEWNQAARISSGSFLTLGMVVAPCSTRSLAAISLGYANTLIHRAADVTMKEGRPLVLLVEGATIGDAERRHVARLRAVPGVRVEPCPSDLVPAARDAMLTGLLRDLGVQALPVPA